MWIRVVYTGVDCGTYTLLLYSIKECFKMLESGQYRWCDDKQHTVKEFFFFF